MQDIKNELQLIFADPERFEDGMLQLLKIIGVPNLQRDCYLIMARYREANNQFKKSGITSHDEYKRDLNAIRLSVFTLIDQLKPEDLANHHPIKCLILADSPQHLEKFSHYYRQRFELENVEFEVTQEQEFSAPVGYDFVIFDGYTLPRSGGPELSSTQQKRLDLLLEYLTVDKYTEVPMVPILYFGPQRNELYNFPERYVAANSWITLFARTTDMVNYLRQLSVV